MVRKVCISFFILFASDLAQAQVGWQLSKVVQDSFRALHEYTEQVNYSPNGRLYRAKSTVFDAHSDNSVCSLASLINKNVWRESQDVVYGFSPDSSLIFVGLNYRFEHAKKLSGILVELGSCKLVKEFYMGSDVPYSRNYLDFISVIISPDNKKIFAFTNKGAFVTWDVDGAHNLSKNYTEFHEYPDIVFSDDGKLQIGPTLKEVEYGRQNLVTVWNTSGSPVFSIPDFYKTKKMRQYRFLSDGSILLLYTEFNYKYHSDVLYVDNYSPNGQLLYHSELPSMSFSSLSLSGRFIVSYLYDQTRDTNRINVLDWRSGKSTEWESRLAGPDPSHYLQALFSRDEKQLFFFSENTTTVQVWDVDTGSKVQDIREGKIKGMAVNPLDDTVLIWTQDRWITNWVLGRLTAWKMGTISPPPQTLSFCEDLRRPAEWTNGVRCQTKAGFEFKRVQEGWMDTLNNVIWLDKEQKGTNVGCSIPYALPLVENFKDGLTRGLLELFPEIEKSTYWTSDKTTDPEKAIVIRGSNGATTWDWNINSHNFTRCTLKN